MSSRSVMGAYELLSEQATLGYYDDGTRIEADKTYYYKVTALDAFGNESEALASAFAKIHPDAMSPVIGDMTPGEGAALCKTATVAVSATDNYRLSHAVFSYRAVGTAEWAEISTVRLDTAENNAVISTDWEIADLDTGDYELRADVYDTSANDTAGGAYAANTPATLTRTVHITRYTAPVAPSMTVTTGYKTATLQWTYSGNEAILRGYSIYAADSANGEYGLVRSVAPGVTSLTLDIPAGQNVSFKVIATDVFGANAESDVKTAASTGSDTVAPVAVLSPETLLTAVNVPFLFSAVNSTDNDVIASYAWSFGDGSASSDVAPTHTYAAAGTYTVTLTVTDECGNADTANAEMKVVDTAAAGSEYTLVTLKVVDAASSELTPIGGATLAITYGQESADTTTAVTDANGTVTLLMPVGEHIVSATAGGYMPTAKNLKVAASADGTMDAMIGVSAVQLVMGELTATEMTYDEIVAAGIDVSNPDNQHVWKFETTFEFEVLNETFRLPDNIPLTVGYSNDAGHFTNSSGGWYTFVSDGSGGSGTSSGGASAGGRRSYRIGVFPTQKEGYYLIIYGEAHWLKEMYNVELLVMNNSNLDTIQNGVATLDLPDGLSLAAMLDRQQSKQIVLDTVAPNEQTVARWYVMGDEEGEYYLSASLTGDLVNGSVSEPFRYSFATSKPIKVYAGSALKMTVTANDYAVVNHHYPVLYRFENVSDKTLYNLSFAITGIEEGKLVLVRDVNGDGELVKEERYSEDFADTYTQSVEKLEPGEYIECEVDVMCWFKTEEELYIERIFRGEDESRLGIIDISSGIGRFDVTTAEGSSTSVPSEVVIRTAEKNSNIEYVFSHVIQKLTYDAENPDVIILFLEDVDTAIEKEYSGILRQGDGWTMWWKCVYYQNELGARYSPQLEIYVEGGNTADGELYTYSEADTENGGNTMPWFEATGFDRDDFVSVSLRGTSVNSLNLIVDQFYGYAGIKSVELSYVSGIGRRTFMNCTSLQSVRSIFGAVKGIGTEAFKNCGSLSSFSANTSKLLSIGEDAFYGTKITSFDLGDTMKELGARAFNGCSELKVITVPNTLKVVSEEAFAGCYSLSDVYYEGVTAAWQTISIADGNEALLAAELHYVPEPEIYVRGEVITTLPCPFEQIVFSKGSTEYNEDLSYYLMCLAHSVYNDKDIEDTLEHILFEILKEDLSDSPSGPLQTDLSGFVISQKELSDGSRIVLITIRGSHGYNWNNLLDVGVSGLGLGKYPAMENDATNIYNALKECLGGLPTENITYVITGHSQGAGAGNLLACKLYDNGIPSSIVYDYNFACPNVACLINQWDWNPNGVHDNIFNIGNIEDIVTLIPDNVVHKVVFLKVPIVGELNMLSAWGKFGQSFWFQPSTGHNIVGHAMDVYVRELATRPTVYSLAEITAKRTLDGILKTFTGVGIFCPVDVVISDENGAAVAGAENNQANYYDSEMGEVLIFIDGDHKIFYLPSDHNYDIHLRATDEGSMTYVTFVVDQEEGAVDSVKLFEDVDLALNKEMISSVGVDIEAEDVKLYVVNDTGDVTQEITENGTEVTVYTISFNANGHGDAPEAQIIATGGKAVEPAAPTADGYTFDGWYKESGCLNQWNFETDTVTRNAELFAKWTAVSGSNDAGSGDDGGSQSSGSPSPNSQTKHKDGAKTETSTMQDGSTITTTTVDGVISELSIALSAAALAAGKPILLPMTISVGSNVANAVAIKITLPAGTKIPALVSQMPEVEIPLVGGTAGTVAYRRDADGTLTLIKECRMGNLIIPLSGDCELLIVDNTKTFSDVSETSWYAEYVQFVTAREIFNGTDQGFLPNSSMSRAMVAQVLHNLDRHSDASSVSSFSDVSTGAWYAAAVSWAAKEEIITGYGGAFSPDVAITRQDLVTILYRYATKAGYLTTERAVLSNYPDAATVAPYAEEAMSWAVGKGIINGVDGSLSPTTTATRAQVAAIITRFLNTAR